MNPSRSSPAHSDRAPRFARALASLLLVLAPAAPAAQGLVGWGDNASGQATVPSRITAATSVAAGKMHSLALLPDGTIAAWGAGTTNRGVAPDWGQAATTDPGAVLAIAAGAYQSLALHRDGTVRAWGRCLPADGLAGIAAVAGGDGHAVALFQGGTVTVWGTNLVSQLPVPYDGREVVAVAAGDDHVLALRADGTVIAWGTNSAGQCDVPANLGPAVAVAAGARHSLALRPDGTVLAWGLNDAGQCTPPPGLAEVAEIAAGNRHSLARTTHGRVIAWGSNARGQCDVPPALTNAVRIAAGGDHCLAIWSSNPPPSWPVPPGLRAGLGEPLDASLAALGGATNYDALFLPPGLVLDRASGRLTGTPSIAGCFNVPVLARNAEGIASTPAHLVIRPLTIAAWTDAKFTAAQRADPNTAGEAADPDQDGLANALEYLLGTEPLAADARGAIRFGLENLPDGPVPSLSYPSPRTRTDARLVPEVSYDLVNWVGLAGLYQTVETASNAPLPRVTLRGAQPVPRTAEFIRLRAEVNPAGVPVETRPVAASAEPQVFEVNSRLRITIPGGTLPQPTTLTVSTTPPSPPPDSRTLAPLAGYDINLGGQHEFAQPLTLELSYDPAMLRTDCRPSSAFLVVYWDEQRTEWVPMPFTVDTAQHRIVVQTRHLTFIGWWMWQWGCGVYDRVDPFVVIYDPADFAPGSTRTFYNTNTLFATPREYSFLLETGVPTYVSETADFLGNIHRFYRTDSGLKLRDGPFNIVIGTDYVDSFHEKISGLVLVNLNNLGRQQLALVLAHEFFHQAVQSSYYTFLGASRLAARTWWLEATAEYAAARIAWRMNYVVSAQEPQREFLRYALNTKDNVHEYNAGQFVDFLVRRGVSFPALFEAVAATKVPFVVIQPLNEYLTARHHMPLGEYYHQFVADWLFNPNGYLKTADPSSPPIADYQTDVETSLKKFAQTFSVDGGCTARIWALRIQTDTDNPKRKFSLQATEWPVETADVRADLYLLKRNDRQAGLQPVAFLQAITDTQEVEAENGDVLYVIPINCGGASAVAATIEVTDLTAPPVKPRTLEGHLEIVLPNFLTRAARLQIQANAEIALPKDTLGLVQTNRDSWGVPTSVDLSVYRVNKGVPIGIDLTTAFQLTLFAETENGRQELPSDGESTWTTLLNGELKTETTVENPRLLVGGEEHSIGNDAEELTLGVAANKDLVALVEFALDYRQSVYTNNPVTRTWDLDAKASKLVTTPFRSRLLNLKIYQ